MKRQLTRWVIVGLVTNAVLYLAYLVLTRSLFSPKMAMTVVYVAGVLLGFVGHRTWSFEHTGPANLALLRYIAAYASGYAMNFVGLVIGIDVLGQPHEAVQAAMVVIVAMTMFVVQKAYVFSEPKTNADRHAKVDT